MAEEIAFHGIGGPLMQAEGLVPLFPMEELSVIGLTEIIANYRRLARRVTDTADAVIGWKPDALITIDIPEFSLRVAAQVKARAHRICRPSITSRPRSGRGGPNARARWRAASTMCWRCCRSSRPTCRPKA